MACSGLISICGSSPRVRGTPRWSLSPQLMRRFIPAGAGNARKPPPGCSGSTVHPRGCGERLGAAYRQPGSAGSSPRVRGTLKLHRLGCLADRFIPAGAGNAAPDGAAAKCRAVHPRGCGERRRRRRQVQRRGGSSPRVRGTLGGVHPRAVESRFIPAGAGNARCQGNARHRHPVHPRGCGERAARAASGALSGGSSPRVRGTPDSRQALGRSCRFIPAGAGNASRPSE